MPLSPPNHHVLLFIHAGTDARHFILPGPARGIAWRLLVEHGGRQPRRHLSDLDGPPLPGNGVVPMEARSMVVYVAPDVPARSHSLPPPILWNHEP